MPLARVVEVVVFACIKDAVSFEQNFSSSGKYISTLHEHGDALSLQNVKVGTCRSITIESNMPETTTHKMCPKWYHDRKWRAKSQKVECHSKFQTRMRQSLQKLGYNF